MIFVSAVERWAPEISARSEARAPKDHHGLCQRGCPSEESRERLEAEPETRDTGRGPREHQDPGEAGPGRALGMPAELPQGFTLQGNGYTRQPTTSFEHVCFCFCKEKSIPQRCHLQKVLCRCLRLWSVGVSVSASVFA